MKILNFIVWQWQKFQVWQKLFFLCFLLLGVSTTAPDHIRIWMLSLAMIIPLFFVCKWWIWDGVKDSWKQYQDEQKKILDIIKGDK